MLACATSQGAAPRNKAITLSITPRGAVRSSHKKARATAASPSDNSRRQAADEPARAPLNTRWWMMHGTSRQTYTGAGLRLCQMWGEAPPHAVESTSKRQRAHCRAADDAAHATAFARVYGYIKRLIYNRLNGPFAPQQAFSSRTSQQCQRRRRTRLTLMTHRATQGRRSRTGFGPAPWLCGRSASTSAPRSCSSGRCRSRGWCAAAEITLPSARTAALCMHHKAPPHPCAGVLVVLLWQVAVAHNDCRHDHRGRPRANL